MNYRGLYTKGELPPCRVCGMTAGKRMVSDENPERYFVVCEVCGFRTKPHPNQSAATKDWIGTKE